MARDQSRRPTPRKRGGSAPKVKPSGSLAPKRAPKPSRPARATKPAKVARPSKVAKPAKVAKAARSVKASGATKAPKTAGRAAAPKLTMVGGAAQPAPANKQRPSKRSKAPVPGAVAPVATKVAKPKAASAPAGRRPGFLDRAAGSLPSRSRSSAATQRPSGGAERRQRYQRGQALRVAGIAAGAVAALSLVLAVAYFVLRDAPVFAVEHVEVEPTEHVSALDLQNLVSVPVGSTLLNLDEQAVREGILKDPWVADVAFERVFPHTLKVNVIEQSIDALVVMNAGSVAWYLGDAGIWIQPTSVETAEGQSVNDAALRIALDTGCLLITDVPASVSPVAGSQATDAVLEAVRKFRDGFSDSFAEQVACFSAPAEDSIACTLYNGVEVLLGSPTDIAAKEEIVTETLAELPEGSVTYINVRVVSSPAVRPVASDNVEPGSGVVSLLEPEGGTDDDAAAGDGTNAGDGTDTDGGTDTGDGADGAAADDGSGAADGNDAASDGGLEGSDGSYGSAEGSAE